MIENNSKEEISDDIKEYIAYSNGNKVPSKEYVVLVNKKGLKELKKMQNRFQKKAIK